MELGRLDVAIESALVPALEQSIVASVLIDENDHVLFFNQAAEHLWGYGREEVLGRHMGRLLPFALQQTHGGYIRKNREGGEPRAVGMSRDILVERKDGSRLWATFSLSKIDFDGRIYYMAFARDVSDEVARREERRLLMLVVDNTDRAMVVLDDQRRIVQTNQAFVRLFGYTVDEVIGRLPSQFLASPNADPIALERVRQHAWGSSRFSAEVLTRSKDGRDIWVSTAVNPVFDETDGEQLRNIVIVVSDVTEKRQIRDLERDVLQALTSSLPFQEVGNFLCRRVREISPDIHPSILRVDHQRRLHSWAAASLPDTFSHTIDGMEAGEGVGSCGSAAARGMPVISSDIEHDPLWAPYASVALAHGFRACWSYPVRRRNGTVAGTFAFYASEVREPTAFHERIIEVCTHLCSLAIENEENRAQMERLVHFDRLTGLPNRESLYRHLDDLLVTTLRSSVALLAIGLDRFKDINEALGHSVGDQVLVEIASRLQHHLEQDEFVSHIEGDMFVVLAPNDDAESILRLVHRLQQAIGKTIDVGEHQLSLSACVGISQYPEGGRHGSALLEDAKKAMYQAKASGSGAYRFFSPQMNQQAHDRILLGAALKRAITEGKLHLHYQPQLRPDSGEFYGVEALARWDDPEFGAIPPDRFSRLAEDIGEIEALGRWALREACRQMAEWRAAKVRIPAVSVNLSPLSFRDKHLPAHVAALLREYALPGNALTVEITESAAMALTPEMLNVVHGIRSLEVGLSVDDFGTGFSSLANLASLPVTEVKIDRSFVARCLQESRFRSLVTAVIGIGHSLGLTVVAEGVETEAQSEFLQQQHCPVLQGHLYCHPLDPKELPARLASLPPACATSSHTPPSCR